ncbi:hypothetical protein ACHHYP_01089 [Achlya hypogyna]|uniref:HMG box domain-containing protein n=1 Tax=Achlya hypogyna TaxID=1202772 RepID=A0A1V9Z9B7_ACHHY|nr:hypothetical protein ACHHYP_01089 [Achlya hypogyna]
MASVRPWRNAYLHFAGNKRAEIVATRPDWGNEAVSRELGRLWKALPPLDRKVWTNLAAYDRARYLAETQVVSNTEAQPPLLHTTQNDMDLPYEAQSFLLLPHPAAMLDDALVLPPVEATPTPPAKRRHPNRAFFYFWRAQRSTVRAAHPTIPPHTLGKEISKLWRALSASEKAPWVALAAAEMPSAAAALKRKDPHAPKPPKSAFQVFVEHRIATEESLRGVPYNAVTKESAQRWRMMTDAHKAAFVRLASDDTVRYRNEVRAYRAPEPTAEPTSTKRRSDARDPRARVKKTPKRAYPRSAFVHYQLHMRSRFGELPHNEYMVTIAREWKGLSEADKRTWKEIAQAEQARLAAEPSAPSSAPLDGASLRDSLGPPSTVLPAASSGFALFVHAKKPRILQAEPHLSHNELVHKVSKLWRSLSTEEKTPWRDLAKASTPRVPATKKAELHGLDEFNLMEDLWDDEGQGAVDILYDECLPKSL